MVNSFELPIDRDEFINRVEKFLFALRAQRLLVVGIFGFYGGKLFFGQETLSAVKQNRHARFVSRMQRLFALISLRCALRYRAQRSRLT